MKEYKLVFGNTETTIPIIPSLSVYKRIYCYYSSLWSYLNREKRFYVVPLNKNSVNMFDDTNCFPYGVYANILFDEEKLKHVNFNSRMNLFLKYY